MSQRPIHVNLSDTDTDNIKAQDDAAWLNSIVAGDNRDDTVSLYYGDNLELTIINDNKVRLGSGLICMQGHILRIPDYEEFVIQNGVVGKKRIDLLVAEYRKGSDRDYYNLKIVTGEFSANDPVKPSLIKQDIFSSGTVYQEEIAVIEIRSTTIMSARLTLKSFTSIYTIGKALEENIELSVKGWENVNPHYNKVNFVVEREWTAPSDGYMYVQCNPDTNGGLQHAVFHDMTSDVRVGHAMSYKKITAICNFIVIAGHTYRMSYSERVDSTEGHFIPFKR